MERYSQTFNYAKCHYKTHNTARDLIQVVSADVGYGVSAPEAEKRLLELAVERCNEDYEALCLKYDRVKAALMALQFCKVKELAKPDFEELLPQAKAPSDIGWLPQPH